MMKTQYEINKSQHTKYNKQNKKPETKKITLFVAAKSITFTSISSGKNIVVTS